MGKKCVFEVLVTPPRLAIVEEGSRHRTFHHLALGSSLLYISTVPYFHFLPRVLAQPQLGAVPAPGRHRLRDRRLSDWRVRDAGADRFRL